MVLDKDKTVLVTRQINLNIYLRDIQFTNERVLLFPTYPLFFHL